MTLASRFPGRRPRVARAMGVALSAAVIASASCAPSEPSDARQASQPPTFNGLVVLLVIDQLPQFLLDRYDTLFVGGFRRLLDEGRVITARARVPLGGRRDDVEEKRSGPVYGDDGSAGRPYA